MTHNIDKSKFLIREISEIYSNPKYGDYIVYKGYQFAFDGVEWVVVQ